MCAYACLPIRKVLRSQHHRHLHQDWSLVQLLYSVALLLTGSSLTTTPKIFLVPLWLFWHATLPGTWLIHVAIRYCRFCMASPWWINRCQEEYQLCESGEDVVVIYKRLCSVNLKLRRTGVPRGRGKGVQIPHWIFKKIVLCVCKIYFSSPAIMFIKSKLLYRKTLEIVR